VPTEEVEEYSSQNLPTGYFRRTKQRQPTSDFQDNSRVSATDPNLRVTIQSMNLFLIGYRGSGKTTIAKLVAAQLGWSWLDADVELERNAGRTIKEIFAADGEETFRDLEQATIERLAAGDQQVIALGGGAILRDANRQTIAARGKTVWLQATAETLLSRIDADPTTSARRPNLTASGGLEEIRQLLAQRTPLYEQSADHIVATEGRSPAEIAAEIVKWWEEAKC
jgi:shikimate kinase